jgi:zinc D-Ala-D-Ala dipeptidase
MKRILSGLLLLFFTAFSGLAQTTDTLNKYGLYVIKSVAQLERIIDADTNKAFVRIKDFVPGVILDIKYATTENVFYEKLYDKPHAYTMLPVAKALAAVQQDLNQQGLGLKIYDAYRPYSVTCRMWDRLPDSIYMGKPWRGSNHNRGIALDLTLIDLRTKRELAMPTPFDALVYASHPDFMGLPDSVIRNRQILIDAMSKQGFSVSLREWWHFNFTAGSGYEVLDIPPAQINKLIKKKR